jgi:hypothetical protein
MFDGNDVVVKGRVSSGDVDIAKCNIDTREEPKFVKLSSGLTKEQRVEYTELLREFSYVFAWNY